MSSPADSSTREKAVELLDLPREVLLSLKSSLETLRCHISFSQACRELRGLYQLSEDADNDFAVILRKLSVGKPRVPLQRMRYDAPTWIEHANRVCRHAEHCEFKHCSYIASTPVHEIPSLDVLTPSHDEEARSGITNSLNLWELGGGKHKSRSDYEWFDFDMPLGEDTECLTSHYAASSVFATTKPVSHLTLRDPSTGVHAWSAGTVNARGVTVLDVVDAVMASWGKDLVEHDMDELLASDGPHGGLYSLKRDVYFLGEEVFMDATFTLSPDFVGQVQLTR